MAIEEGGSIGTDVSTGYLSSKEKEIRIPVTDMETGKSEVLVLRNQKEIDKLLQSLRDQDGEWD